MATVDMKLTKIDGATHLGMFATGKARLVKDASGIAIGFVKTKFGGVLGVGSLTTSKVSFHYFGADGKYLVKPRLKDIKAAVATLAA